MELFPIELIEAILVSRKLKMEDVVNFGSTCSHFRQIVTGSSYIWRVKFQAKWPEFMKLFDNDFVDWYDETCYIFNLKKRTRQLLASMSVKCYKKVELSDSDYDNWVELVNENPRTYHYLISDLMEIVNTHVSIKSIKVVPIDIPGNKTLQYYAHKVLRYLRQIQLSKQWKEYISNLHDKQILEVGFAIISQWCQPDVDVSPEIISNILDDLANEVRSHIKINYPKHLLNKTSKANLQFWKENRLQRSEWNSLECKQLIKSIAHILYRENRFCESIEDFQMCEALFVNKVLENRVGLPITLGIIYEAVARRVGLKCDTIIFPSHFLIRFTEMEGEKITDSYYIDTLRDGNVFRRGACPHARSNPNSMNNLTPPATSLMVFEALISNLEMAYRHQTLPNEDVVRLRSILELSYLVMPYTAASIVNLLRLYVLYDIDTRPLENSVRVLNMESFSEPRIQEVINTFVTNDKKSNLEPINQGTPKSRPECVKYAVGMVMKHFVLGYTCVIFDWDPVCMASVEWQLQMGVHKLGHKHEQPFYNVIAEDGSHRYAAQENIIPIAIANPTKLLSNERLGKYFSHFFENHFVPNAEMENEFPEDANIRFKIYQKLKNL